MSAVQRDARSRPYGIMHSDLSRGWISCQVFLPQEDKTKQTKAKGQKVITVSWVFAQADIYLIVYIKYEQFFVSQLYM